MVLSVMNSKAIKALHRKMWDTNLSGVWFHHYLQGPEFSAGSTYMYYKRRTLFLIRLIPTTFGSIYPFTYTINSYTCPVHHIFLFFLSLQHIIKHVRYVLIQHVFILSWRLVEHLSCLLMSTWKLLVKFLDQCHLKVAWGKLI